MTYFETKNDINFALNKKKIAYESICEKLGFDVDTYEVPKATTEEEKWR